MADVAVRLVQLTKRFGGDAVGRRVAKSVEGANPDVGFTAVDHIDLDVNEGEFFSLLGPSGCGKTTTLRMIGGLEQPTEGKIELQGEDVTWLPPTSGTSTRSSRTTPCFRTSRSMTTSRSGFAEEGSRRRRQEARHRDARARRAPRLRAPQARQISGGQAQRVALARALVNKPAVLLLDEPLGALDLKLRKQMQVELKRIQQEVGITFIYVTHDQEEAMTMSDRIAVMNHGRYEQLGDPEVLYERPRTRFVAGFLGVSNLLPATADGRDNGSAVFRLSDGSAVRVPAAVVQDRTGDLALGVRPEKIRLLEPKDDVPAGYNQVPGTIDHASYLGVSTQYIVRLRDGHRVTVYEQNVQRATKAELWTSGEEVVLCWSPDHCFVVEDASGEPAITSTPEPTAVA